MMPFLQKHFLAVCCVVVVVALAAPLAVQAQTPTVSVTNTTRGGSGLWYYVGDGYSVQIHGAPNSAVTVSGYHDNWYYEDTPYGYTNGSGDLTITGTQTSTEIGNWYEVWSVGGVQASPTLNMVVWAYPPSYPCQATWYGTPWMYSYDHYHTGETNPYYQERYPEYKWGDVDSADCNAYGVDLQWDYPQYLQVNSSGGYGSWFDVGIQDSGTGRDTYSYYPLWSYPTLEALMYNHAGQYSVKTEDVILLIYRVDD